MKYTTVEGLKWLDPEKTRLGARVTFEGMGAIDMVLTLEDREPDHVKEIFANAKAGKLGPVADPVVPVPQTISDRQFFHALARSPFNLITQAEALAAVKTGDIPPSLVAVIDKAVAGGMLPPGMERFDVEMLVSGATVFERLHPTTQLIGGLWGMTEAQVDDLFLAAAALK